MITENIVGAQSQAGLGDTPTLQASERSSEVEASRIRLRDLVRESAVTLSRRALRTALAAAGTVLGVAIFQATIGLSMSAGGSVSREFNAQLATEVSFQDTAPSGNGVSFTEGSEARLERIPGVVQAGLEWSLSDGQPMAVTRTSAGLDVAQLPFTIASPGALRTMHAEMSLGRPYDKGMETRHTMVALLGKAAAAQLGIANISAGPAIFVGPNAFTVIGVVGSAREETQALLGVMLPPSEAGVVGGTQAARTLIVNTEPGAAQLVGREGPYVLSPFDPGAIDVQVPPSPRLLRQQVQRSVSGLLFAVAILAFVLGIAIIANTSLLSIAQRRSEIGLRRAVGARPRHIAGLFLMEASLLGLLGGAVGGCLGVVATAVAARVMGWVPVMDWRIELISPALGALAGMVAGAYPSWRAGRIEPIAALQDQ